MKQITDQLKDVNLVVGEVENPYIEEDPTIKKRKQGLLEFYLNNGWKDTGINALMYDVEYRLLYLILGNNLSTSDIQTGYEDIYSAAIRKEELELNMWLRKEG